MLSVSAQLKLKKHRSLDPGERLYIDGWQKTGHKVFWCPGDPYPKWMTDPNDVRPGELLVRSCSPLPGSNTPVALAPPEAAAAPATAPAGEAPDPAAACPPPSSSTPAPTTPKPAPTPAPAPVTPAPAPAPPPTPKATAPTNLRATVSGTTVTLTWNAPSNAAAAKITKYQYKPYKAGNEGVDLGGWADLPGTAGSSTSATLANHEVGTYTYVIWAVGAGGDGARSSSSNSVTINAVKAEAPTGLYLSINGNQVTLNWTPPSNAPAAAITKYQYRRHTSEGKSVWIDLVGTTGSSRSATLAERETGRYRYMIRAVGGAGGGTKSAWSIWVNVRGGPAAPISQSPPRGGIDISQ